MLTIGDCFSVPLRDTVVELKLCKYGDEESSWDIDASNEEDGSGVRD